VAEVRVEFKKVNEAVFISHLDISRLFVRALNRAKIKVKYTNGFNPHAYIVFAVPLSLGYESVCELVEFEVLGDETNEQIVERLNASMPGGIEITDCRPRTGKFKDIGYARWDIVAECESDISDETISKIEALFSEKEISIVKETKRGQTEINLMDKAKELRVSRIDAKSVRIDAVLSSATDDILNPEYVLRAIKDKCAVEFDDVFYTRKMLYDKKMDVFR